VATAAVRGATADHRCTRVVDAPGVTHLTYEVLHCGGSQRAIDRAEAADRSGDTTLPVLTNW
jgi:hypothetical protein